MQPTARGSALQFKKEAITVTEQATSQCNAIAGENKLPQEDMKEAGKKRQGLLIDQRQYNEDKP